MSPARLNRLPSSPFIQFLRWWLGGLVCLAGFVIAAARGFDDIGLEAMFVFFGAGLSIVLMNFLLRVGIKGDDERDDEAAARAYFNEHGRWPDEGGAGAPTDAAAAAPR